MCDNSEITGCVILFVYVELVVQKRVDSWPDDHLFYIESDYEIYKFLKFFLRSEFAAGLAEMESQSKSFTLVSKNSEFW